MSTQVVCFINNPEVVIEGDRRFLLINNFYFKVYDDYYEIPKGFYTDLASVPRVPFVFLFVGSRGHRASIMHDWLYENKTFDRITSDKVFYHALRADGVGHILAWSMYKGVRLGGAAYYNKSARAM